jgi:hypothetical protein
LKQVAAEKDRERAKEELRILTLNIAARLEDDEAANEMLGSYTR